MTHVLAVLLFLQAASSADSDALRKLIQVVPKLPVNRVEIKAPPGVTFEGISSVAADSKGNIYVIHRPAAADPVVVLDPKGNLVRSWGKGMFKIPHGIRIDPAGNVWTVDANTSMVFKFTPEGKKLLEISVGNVPDLTREFCGATDVGFARNGDIYVSDGYCNGRVLQFDAAGKKVREWGKKGSGPGEFNVAHGITVGADGNVYVADRENGRLQWFDPQGKFLGEHRYGGQFYTVAFGPKGDFYAATHPKGVSLDLEFNVVKIDLKSGKILGRSEVRTHAVGIGHDGAIYPATRSPQLIVLRPAP